MADCPSFAACLDHVIYGIVADAENYPCSSCKEVHDLNYMYAPSGEYSIKTSSGLVMEKVCFIMERFAVFAVLVTIMPC